MFCNNDNEDVLSKQTDKRICQLLIWDIFVTHLWKNHDDWVNGYPASRISLSVQRKVWILCKPVILFCCTKETVVEGIIFRGVPLACLAGVQRERWLRRTSFNQSTEQALYFCVFRRERASTRRVGLECETGMTRKAWENCCPACRVLHARLALFISCLKMQRYNTCSEGCHPLTCYMACCRLQDSGVRWIEKARTRK